MTIKCFILGVSLMAITGCTTLVKPKINPLDTNSNDIIKDLSEAHTDFENSVSTLNNANELLDILEYGSAIFAGYTALFTNSVDIKEAALIAASVRGGDALLNASDKYVVINRARRRMGCIMSAALNVEIARATNNAPTGVSSATADGSNTDSADGAGISAGGSSGTKKETAVVTLDSNEKNENQQKWENTIFAIWSDMMIRYNNEWEGTYSGTADAISALESAVKGATDPAQADSTERALLSDKDYRESIVKLLTCPLVQ